jgi:hypothetical protein
MDRMLNKKLTKKLRRAAYKQVVLRRSVNWTGLTKSARKSGLNPTRAVVDALAHVLYRQRRRERSSTLRSFEKDPTPGLLKFIKLVNDTAAALVPEEGWPDDSIEQRLLEQEEFLKCSSPHLIPDLAKIVHDYI